MTTLYVLKLTWDKYYVGKTSDVAKRYQEHRDGTGAAWTRKYKPMSIAKTMPLTSPFDEDKVTKEYMSMYGIDNVRGGVYVSEVLDAAQYTAVQREIWGAKGCCTRCGRKSHFVATCNAHTTIEGAAIVEEEDYDEDDEDDEDDEEDEEDEDDDD